MNTDEDIERMLSRLDSPINKKKKRAIYSSSSSMSDSSLDEERIFYCRFCNKKAKSATERKPETEVCKFCEGNFPERMFCKSCKRFFPDKALFTKAKERCNPCVDRLEKARESRKKRKQETENNSEPSKKKIDDNYVMLVINGQCVHKHNFKF